MSSLEKMQELRENIQDISLEDNFIYDSTPYKLNNDSNNSIWLTSFTDIIALMLVFFVMMFSMSSPKEHGWATIVASLQDEFRGGTEGLGVSGSYGSFDMQQVRKEKALNSNYLFAVLKRIQKKEPELQNIELKLLSKATSMSFDYTDLYTKDNPLEIAINGQKTLDSLAKNIGHLENNMDIILAAPTPDIKNGIEQISKISKIFQDAGYKGKIQILVKTSEVKDIKIIIHSAK